METQKQFLKTFSCLFLEITVFIIRVPSHCRKIYLLTSTNVNIFRLGWFRFRATLSANLYWP